MNSSFFHSFIHAFIILSSMHSSFFHSVIHAFLILSFFHPCIPTFLHSFIFHSSLIFHPSISSFIHSFSLSPSLPSFTSSSSLHLFLHSLLLHPSISSFIHSFSISPSLLSFTSSSSLPSFLHLSFSNHFLLNKPSNNFFPITFQSSFQSSSSMRIRHNILLRNFQSRLCCPPSWIAHLLRLMFDVETL